MKHKTYDQNLGLDLRIMRPEWEYKPRSKDQDQIRFNEGWHCNDADWVGELQGRIKTFTVDITPRKLATFNRGDCIRLDGASLLSWIGWSDPHNVKALGDYEIVAKQEKEEMELKKFDDRTRKFEKDLADVGVAYLLRPLVEFNRETFEQYSPRSEEARVMKALLKTYATRRNRAPHSVISNLTQQSSLSEDQVRKIFEELSIRPFQAERVKCTLS